MSASELEAAFARARNVHKRLHGLIDGLEVKADLRARLSGGCFYVALDIQAAITLLCDNQIYPAAFILSRSVWEAYIRGTWLAECADPRWLDRFAKGDEPPQIGQMIEAIERCPAFDAGVLSRAHGVAWQRFNGLTHIGAPLVLRCSTAEHFEADFDPQEVSEGLDHAAAVAILAALGIAKLANSGGVQTALIELSLSHYPDAR